MHRMNNVKFINVQEARDIYQFNNIKEKLYITSASVWFNSMYRRELTRSYISKKVNGTN
jgi:hypothetical protein